jgi:hypothetical protein
MLQHQQAGAEVDGERPPMPRKPSLKRASGTQHEEKSKEKLLAVVAEPEEIKKSGTTRAPKLAHARRSSLGEGLKKEKFTSFTTGPDSVPTHWKQTVFLLREPISAQEGVWFFILSRYMPYAP